MTDYYLDSCVFDLVTTGDTSFIAAARAAHRDLWSQDPRTAYSTLQNCTNWPCHAQFSGSSGLFSDAFAILLLCTTVIFLVQNSVTPIR